MIKVIAEVGSNWHGRGESYNEIYDSIRYAKEDGADAVKLQYLSGKELYGFPVPSLDEYSIPLDVLQRLKNYADEQQIEFMCSAFSIQGYNDIDPLVKTHKIASSEASWGDLVACAISFGKPTIISTGGLSNCQTKRIVEHWNKTYVAGDDLTLLYCDPTYPSDKSDNDVYCGVERLLKYGVDVGLSDHSLLTSIFPSIGENISVIEKHYNPLHLEDTPDAGHSLGREKFRELVANIKALRQSFTHNPHARVETKDGWFRPYFGDK